MVQGPPGPCRAARSPRLTTRRFAAMHSRCGGESAGMLGGTAEPSRRRRERRDTKQRLWARRGRFCRKRRWRR